MLRGVMGCSRGVPGLFRAVPGCSGGVPGVFRGVPGCSGVFRVCSGFYRHPDFNCIDQTSSRDVKNREYFNTVLSLLFPVHSTFQLYSFHCFVFTVHYTSSALDLWASLLTLQSTMNMSVFFNLFALAKCFAKGSLAFRRKALALRATC